MTETQFQNEYIDVVNEALSKALDVVIKLAWFNRCRLKEFAITPDRVYMLVEGRISEAYQWERALNTAFKRDGIRVKIDVDDRESTIYIYRVYPL